MTPYKSTITISARRSPREIEAKRFGAFATHPSENDKITGYSVTHVPSGFALPHFVVDELTEPEADAIAAHLTERWGEMPVEQRPGSEDRWAFEALVAEALMGETAESLS